MKRLMKRLEDIMVAITFAEVGEYEAAKKLAASAEPEVEEPVKEQEVKAEA